MSIAYASRIFEFSRLATYMSCWTLATESIRGASMPYVICVWTSISTLDVTDFQEERESLAFFRAWWRSWEIVAAMRGLEEIQVLIGNTNFDNDILGEDDETWILGSWCAIMQIMSFNVGVGWRLFRPETRMSNLPFRDNRS